MSRQRIGKPKPRTISDLTTIDKWVEYCLEKNIYTQEVMSDILRMLHQKKYSYGFGVRKDGTANPRMAWDLSNWDLAISRYHGPHHTDFGIGGSPLRIVSLFDMSADRLPELLTTICEDRARGETRVAAIGGTIPFEKEFAIGRFVGFAVHRQDMQIDTMEMHPKSMRRSQGVLYIFDPKAPKQFLVDNRCVGALRLEMISKTKVRPANGSLDKFLTDLTEGTGQINWGASPHGHMGLARTLTLEYAANWGFDVDARVGRLIENRVREVATTLASADKKDHLPPEVVTVSDDSPRAEAVSMIVPTGMPPHKLGTFLLACGRFPTPDEALCMPDIPKKARANSQRSAR